MNKQKRKAQIEKLIELKLKLEVAKTLYGQYDEVLAKLIKAGSVPKQVSYKGAMWNLELVDNFSSKNTAWKSVAMRQFDISVSRLDGFFKTRKER